MLLLNNFTLVLIWFSLHACNNHAASEEDLKFKIAMPEYICDKDGSIREISKDVTSIRFLGEDAHSLAYDFDVNFKRIGSKCSNSQRCTLLTWKSIRILNKFLQDYPSAQLETGVVEINNTMFLPGIQYILNVTIRKGDDIVERKQLTMDYVDEDVRKSAKKPMASVSLLGPDSSYAFATLVINAEISICSNITGYYDSQTITTLGKGIFLSLPIRTSTTGVGQPIKISANVEDMDNTNMGLKINWSCVESTTNQKCDCESDTSELELVSGFAQEGTYNISVEVSKDEEFQSDYCTVKVVRDAPTVEFAEIEDPVSPSKGVEIKARIYELKSFCTLQWISVGEDGHEHLNLSTVPGADHEVVSVTLKEDLFLNELEDFSNGTVNKEHVLTIPPPSDEWVGLKGGTAYMFRLIVKCPQIERDSGGDNMTEPILATESSNLITHNDVVIRTDDAPSVKALEVRPAKGEAFITSFHFKTQKANDRDGDGRFLYKFGYMLGNRSVVVWSSSEITSAPTVLPFSGAFLVPFLEPRKGELRQICRSIIKTFEEKMNTEDYYKAFCFALSAMETLKAQKESEQYLKQLHDYVENRIDEEIKKWLSFKDGASSWRIGANGLIRNLNEFSDDLELPEATLNDLIQLRDKLSDRYVDNNHINGKHTQRKILAYDRPKRTENLYGVDDIKGYIEVSERAITSSNDSVKIDLEKEKLRRNLNGYIEKLCISLYKKSQNLQLEFKTVIMSVEKLTKNTFSNYVVIPFEKNKWQSNARIRLGTALYEANKANNKMCIGKAAFRGHFDKSSTVFMVKIVSGSSENIQEASGDIMVFLPRLQNNTSQFKCIAFYDDAWHDDCKMIQKLAKYVQCACNHLGYYLLEYKETTDNTALTTTTLVLESGVTEATPSDGPIKVNEISNETLLERMVDSSTDNYETISYVVISASVIGILILAVILRKIIHDDEDDEEFSDTLEFPKYAKLHDEDTLNDTHM